MGALSSIVVIAVDIDIVFLASHEAATVPVEKGYGPNPVLPTPNAPLIPTVNITSASSWPDGVKPIPAAGLSANEFASWLDQPRWTFVQANGDVFVSELYAPSTFRQGRSIITRPKM